MTSNRTALKDPITGKTIDTPVRLKESGKIVDISTAIKLGLGYVLIEPQRQHTKGQKSPFKKQEYLDYDHRYKVCILGSAGDSDASGTGSQSLMLRFADNQFYEIGYYAPNQDIQYKIRTIYYNNLTIKLDIFPSQRHESFRFKESAYSDFLKGATAIMMTVELINNNLEQYVLNKVKLIRQYSELPIILVGTKSDLVSADQLILLEKKLSQLKDKLQLDGSIVVSAKTDTNVNEAFDLVTECCLGIKQYQKQLMDYLKSELIRQESTTEKYNLLKNIYLDMTSKSYGSPDELKDITAKVRSIVSQHNVTGIEGFFKGNFIKDPIGLDNFNKIFDEHNDLVTKNPNNPQLPIDLDRINQQQTNKIFDQKKFLPLHELKKIVLLDVDETIKIKGRGVDGRPFYGINKNLIEELRKNNVKDVCFFTNMELTDMDNIPNPSGHNYITRRQLVEFFKTHGIRVHAVITQADVEYKRGLGAAYNDFYEPAYDACLTDPELYRKNKDNIGSYKKQYDECKNKINSHPKFDKKNNDKGQSQKKLMFNYFKEVINNNSLEITYYDDSVECLNAIKEVDPSVKTIQIKADKATPLIVPFETKEQFDTFTVNINMGDTSNTSINTANNSSSSSNLTSQLHFEPLSKDMSRETVTEIKRAIQSELEILKGIYSHIPEFKSKFDACLIGITFDDYIHNQENILENDNDIYGARRNMVSQISAMLDNHSDLYKQIISIPLENESKFNLKSKLNLFDAFPNLVSNLIPRNNEALRGLARFLFIELERKLMAIPDKGNAIVQSNTNFDDTVTFLKDTIDDKIQNGPKDSFFSAEPEKNRISLHYLKIICLANKLSSKCDEMQIKNNSVPKKNQLSN